jgi:hypothetical protein
MDDSAAEPSSLLIFRAVVPNLGVRTYTTLDLRP